MSGRTEGDGHVHDAIDTIQPPPTRACAARRVPRAGAGLCRRRRGVADRRGAADRPFPVDLERTSIPRSRACSPADGSPPTDLVDAYLDRIRALNSQGPGLNAVRALNPHATRRPDASTRNAAAPGPRSDARHSGTDQGQHRPGRAADHRRRDRVAALVPGADAFLVGRLRAAGAIILGKINLTEFANFTTVGMPSGYSGLGGQVLNPYDVSQTPSGSSSGSAVAAATALAAVTVGTETSGSILSPAVANSLVGVKPTVGLISRTGIVPIAASQDTAGPMTRSVYDAAALLTAHDRDRPGRPGHVDQRRRGRHRLHAGAVEDRAGRRADRRGERADRQPGRPVQPGGGRAAGPGRHRRTGHGGHRRAAAEHPHL